MRKKEAIFCTIFSFTFFGVIHHTSHESLFITMPTITGRKLSPPVSQYGRERHIEKHPKLETNRPGDISAYSAGNRYALSSSYWEQQTNAILNLYCFQRWANSVGLKVVEPFASQSKLQFPDEILYDYHNKSKTLHFHDYVDIEYYNSQTNLLGGVPALVPWVKFVRHSGKRIVVLIITHHCRPSGIYINDEIKASQHTACNKEMSLFYEKHSQLMHSLQFEVVRNICISIFKYSNVMSPEEFNSFLDLDNFKGDITLWVSEWRGIGTGRITFTGIRESEFYRLRGGKDHLLTMIRPSKRILSDSKRYVRQVLACNFNQYDAVVVRVRPFRNLTVEKNLLFFEDCATQLEQYLNGLKSRKTFLGISLGRFGDMDVLNYYDHDFDHNSHGQYTGNGQKLLQRFLNIVYGAEGKTINTYDDEFIRATGGLVDNGYIATVQKTIATHARSLVVLGGRSSFQRSIIVNYQANNHTTIKRICYSEFD